MLSAEDLDTYKDELIRENTIGLRFITMLEPAMVQNKPFTSGLTPKATKSIKNACWIDQWMALSGLTSGRCRCAACGKFIFANTSDPECVKLAKAYNSQGIIPDCTPETLQLIGGHVVLLKNITDGRYLLAKRGSTFIVPLCKECNNSTVNNLVLSTQTVITPEIR